MTTRTAFAVAALYAAFPLAAQATDQEHLQKNVFAQMRWQELGPVATGGRIVDLVVHPQNQNIWWVASANGGIWKTANNGISFTPQFQDAYSISIGDLVIAPSEPSTLYLGTGESNNQRSSYWGNGVYKSTDGGTTFTHIGLEGTDHIGKIAVHPKNPNVLFVAALGALYKSNLDRGLYRSKNGGDSWQCVKHLGADTGFVDVAIDPNNPEVIYAASYERRRRAFNFTDGGVGSRIYKSIDGGDSWEQVSGGLPTGVLGRIGIELFPADSKTLYACIENLNPNTALPPVEPKTESNGEPADQSHKAAQPDAETLADPLAAAEFAQQAEPQEGERAPRGKTIGGELWRSDDAGATWRKTNKASVGGDPFYYYGQVRVDPQNKDTVYVLGVQVSRSTDGGKTWGRGRSSFAGSLHSDHHALWIDPRDGQHAILGNDGGLGITHDGGANWDHVARLPIAQFYTVAVDMAEPYHVYGGLQDNGTWGFPIRTKNSGGLTATDAYRIDGGDGFYVVCDPSDPDTVYSESQFGGMSRQNLRTGERRGIKPTTEKGSPPLRFNWMTPIALSPHAKDTVYTGSQYLHRSRNRGDSWTVISGDLTTNDPDKKKGSVPHCTITTIAESPKRAGVIYAGTDDGHVWQTKDDGQRWTDLSERLPLATRGLWVSRIEASPHDENTAFVSLTGYREDRREPLLFRTDDAGETFRSIANDLPMEPINVIRQHPRNAHVLLCGTDFGAYASIDDGAAWFRLGNNLPRTAVHDLVVHPRDRHVLVGTHGRGIWTMDGRAFDTLSSDTIGQALLVLPPSDGVLLPRAYNQGSVGMRTWSASNPYTAATFRFHLSQDDVRKVKVEVVDAASAVLFTQEVEGKAGYHEVAWQARGFGGGFGGGAGGGRGGRGGGAGGPRPGQFAVRVTLGDTSETLAFWIYDLRGSRSPLGGTPGIGAAGAAEELVAERSEAEAEAEAEAEENEGAAGSERRGGY
ncbi:hypothetical protein LBMAG49_29090 [Planctomycetota bacterium]|nr:hypothetical protein LBMAG49_29090 [Planctomycetota bacterium]